MLLTNNIFILIELIIFISIAYQDEKEQEISVYKLAILAAVTITKISIAKTISFNTIFFSNILYILIYFISKKAMGLGDLFLNGIIGLNFLGIQSYFYYFTMTFILASCHNIILIILKKVKLNSYIAFAKYMIIAYEIFQLGGYFV